MDRKRNSASRGRVMAGFTLVELLVVIGIIALLISILLPALNKARESAVAIACSSNLRQTGIALRMYQDDWKGFIPAAVTPGVLWMHSLAPYIGGDRPYDRMRCPFISELEINNSAVLTYGLNTVLVRFNVDEPKKIDTLKNPVEIIFVTDTIARNSAAVINPYNTSYLLMPQDDTPYTALPWSMYGIVEQRHNKKSNVLYVDLHVVPAIIPRNDRGSENNQHPWKGMY